MTTLRLSVLGLLLLIAGPDLAAQFAGDSLLIIRQEAGRAMRDLDYDRARPLYEQLRQSDSNDVEVLLNLGVIASAQGRIDEARTLLERAYLLEPTNANVSNNLGVLYSEQGNRARALNHFRTAVTTEPGNSSFLYNYGRELQLDQKPDTGLRVLLTSARIDTVNAQIRFSIGNCYSMLRKHDSAALWYDRAVDLGGETADLYYFRGLAKSRLGDLDGAKESLNAAIERRTNYYEALQSLGLVHMQAGEYVAAQVQFEQARVIDSTSLPLWISLGVAYYMGEQFARADTVFYNLLKTDSTAAMQMMSMIETEVAKVRERAGQSR